MIWVSNEIQNKNKQLHIGCRIGDGKEGSKQSPNLQK